ncbi:MAG: RNA polymerase sigma factor [Planctomycetota bacterium]
MIAAARFTVDEITEEVAPVESGAATTATDESLIMRACGQDGAAAFESLVHRYEHSLFGYLRRYLGSAEMAEDVFQATFLQVYLKRMSFEEGRRFRPWLYTIATHQAIDAQRRNRRHRMVSLDLRTKGNTEGVAIGDLIAGDNRIAIDTLLTMEARAWVRSAVEQLPEAMRAVLTLVYDKGLKYSEVATRLGIPVGTVKSRVSTAIHRLHQAC